ncbi:type II toxin-antitoxin system VapC family toxin [Candidatus Mycobacterium methanotrophicum]|uniref:Ribonuclease VapC n=1 Tax=Candidatus Mycobacterium methanotrophicum TaxID=2943498 RepID=A0ABY4QGE8_9MYCO|nr:PIN domain-containing protein [Candidatus Mycobacterium methanotrophicum]UQX10033.1 PIN domain-containing protein [Candidatus Mycobacterium methanotrophicum]
MTLTDAGPLIAIIDADEADHETCALALRTLALPLVTTWPAFTEAMYVLGRAGGAAGQHALWKLLLSKRLDIAELSLAVLERSAALMAKYADRPMDLADATLVALAEARGERRIFTLDNDFRIYRIHGRTRFEVIPG